MTLYLDQRLPQSAVRIRLYDAFGVEQRIEPLVQSLNASTLSVEFDTRSLPAGVYVVVAECGGVRATRKLLVVR
jgi:hypothetical protein